MKWLVIIASIAFASPAAATSLSKIPISQLGTKITKVGSGASILDQVIETTIALEAGNYATAAGHALTVPLIAYNPALGNSAAFVLGLLDNSTFQLENAYNSGDLKNYPDFQSWLDQLFPSDPPSSPNIGDVIQCPKVASGGYSTNNKCKVVELVSANDGQFYFGSYSGAYDNMTYGGTLWSVSGTWTGGYLYSLGLNPPGVSSKNGAYGYYSNTYKLTLSTDPITPVPVGIPDTLSDSQATSLANNAAEKIQNDSDFRTKFENFMKDFPKYFQDLPSSINKTDINNWYNTNNQTINNDYIQNLQSLVNQYPENVELKQELAKAQAEAQKEAEKEPPETFDPINNHAFTPPYNPGEFDIPARFTSFLNNVKTSGLFSFSSSFFNSLPGGGSPVLTINGGQTFGTHIFDFSQALGGGLTILKSVLLALFGFLSIRAVIMKR